MKQYALAILLVACTADDPMSTPQTAAPKTVDVAAMSWRHRVAADLAQNPGGPAAALDRIARRVDPEELRVRMVDALPRTALYADALADLFIEEPSAKVRAAFVRATPAEHAVTILRRAFADPSTEVRIVAIRSASTHTVCERLATELRTLLGDRDAALRAEAARSVGMLKIASARDELVRALEDANADVRLEAMRALDRIKPGSLAGTAAITALRNDPDTRVAELAQQMATRK